MTLEKLKELLDSGAITQEEYDEMSQHATEPAPAADPEPATDPEPAPVIDYDKIERIVQSRVDKQLAAERKKSADLECVTAQKKS